MKFIDEVLPSRLNSPLYERGVGGDFPSAYRSPTRHAPGTRFKSPLPPFAKGGVSSSLLIMYGSYITPPKLQLIP